MRWSRALLVGVLFILLSGTFYAHAEGPTHTVEKGENLFRIALRYGVTVEALAAANNITDPTHIFVGQVLVIPGAAAAPTQAPSQAPAQSPAQAQVAQPNPPDNVPAPANQPPANAVYYTVQPGDTLNIIAKKFGLTWVDISNANNLTNANFIQPGQQIIIPGSSSPAGSATVPTVPNAPAAPTSPPTAISPTTVPPTAIPPTAAPAAAQPAASSGSKTYVVQAGEGLAAIARKFGLTWPVLAQANNISDPNTIYAGMTLTIPDGAPNPNPTTMETSVGVPPGPAPSPTSGKYIKVVLREQRVYAYQDGQLVHTVLASTGLPGTPTVLGDYKIYLKYSSQLMTGPGYYLPGVPWVMYFFEGYSLHGTYWHHNFGHPMSHGCVNLPTEDALWFYNWAEIGTTVHVEW